VPPRLAAAIVVRVAGISFVAAIFATVATCGICAASTGEEPLAAMAAKFFPNLTRAERVMLEYADVANVSRGDFAIAGTSAKPDDPSNDPAHADKWDAQREIRAKLIRWISVYPDAARRVDPQGIKVIGARITGVLDLTLVRVPFAITLRNCSVHEPMELASTEIPALVLDGSYTNSIHANGIRVDGMSMSGGFHVKGWVWLQEAHLGNFAAVDGHFQYAPDNENFLAAYRNVLNLIGADIKGSVYMIDGFEADGSVIFGGTKIGGDLNFDSAHFLNSGQTALDFSGASIAGGVVLASSEIQRIPSEKGGYVIVDGQVRFDGAHIGNILVSQVIFRGKPGDHHGLSAGSANVGGVFLWRDVVMENGAQLDLRGASIGSIVDQERSWPSAGNLNIDGLTYSGFASPEPNDAPGDATTRLRWIARQSGYHPQPYRQLAKVLRESGDDAGAVKVMIESGDRRYSQNGILGRLLGWFLKVTIGYGHRPMLTIMWSFAIVILGWAVVSAAKLANVMRPTYPENAPADSPRRYERLYPMLYSIDIFVPFVNLHQEHYWWPDAESSRKLSVMGMCVRLRGAFILYYLWAQIIAG
jgi:hypothetical protein